MVDCVWDEGQIDGKEQCWACLLNPGIVYGSLLPTGDSYLCSSPYACSGALGFLSGGWV